MSLSEAGLRYEFFTPYRRGFDLVWDFLCAQNEGSFRHGKLSINASYGYERSRDLTLFANGREIGRGTELWERFAALAPVFQQFWRALEDAAHVWQEDKALAESRKEEESRRRDAAFWFAILAASGMEARSGETGTGSTEGESAVVKPDARKDHP